MAARVVTKFAQKGNPQKNNAVAAKVAIAQAPIAQPTATIIEEKKEDFIAPVAKVFQQEVSFKPILSHDERAKFYTGKERLDLQASQVQRIRELQEENDHLQREINARENELHDAKDPLVVIADIEHRKTIIARNTGEVLNIYTRNEERLKKIKELEAQNVKIKEDMKSMQGNFADTKNMDEKTKYASDYFIFRSTVEKNIQEIKELSKN